MLLKLKTRTKVRLARLLYRVVSIWRRLLGAGDIADVKRGGIQWRLDLREGIDLSIYLFGYFERDMVRTYHRLLKPGSTVFDIGANIGAHTLPFARCVGARGKIVAFEPTDYAYAKLNANIERNPDLATVITAEQLMLVDRPDASLPTSIYSSWPVSNTDSSIHPQLQGKAMATTGARATTLDDYVSRTAIKKIDLIKLDVDGYENVVLSGARATLDRDRPTILMEIMSYDPMSGTASFENVLKLLLPLGYRLCDLNERPLPTDRSLIRHIPPDGGINVICRV